MNSQSPTMLLVVIILRANSQAEFLWNCTTHMYPLDPAFHHLYNSDYDQVSRNHLLFVQNVNDQVLQANALCAEFPF